MIYQPKKHEMALYAASVDIANWLGVPLSHLRIVGRFVHFNGQDWLYDHSSPDGSHLIHRHYLEQASKVLVNRLIAYLYFASLDEAKEKGLHHMLIPLAFLVHLEHDWREAKAPDFDEPLKMRINKDRPFDPQAMFKTRDIIVCSRCSIEKSDTYPMFCQDRIEVLPYQGNSKVEWRNP